MPKEQLEASRFLVSDKDVEDIFPGPVIRSDPEELRRTRIMETFGEITEANLVLRAGRLL